MKKKILILLLVAISLFTWNVPVALPQDSEPMLKLVSIDAGPAGAVQKLAGMGIDIASVEEGPVVESPEGIPMQTYRVEAVVSKLDEKQLGREGFSWFDVPGKGPVKKIGEPYDFYHSFDEPINGIKAQLHKIAATYPHIAQLKKVGHSVQKRDLLVMRLTNEKVGKKKKDDKPQVLFVATHHAREWVATEMAMRLIKYLTANYGSDARVTDLLDSVEVWIMPVGNPDGYQYTFTNERLWRKNLHDNDDDGQITIADGVDLNRNFAAHWGLDDEGSSPTWSSSTYRGTAPNSEPETQALVDFIEDNDFKFILNYHTSGNLILYPWGWQVETPSLDDPIFVAQAGTDANPGIWDSRLDEGYNPGVGADLYTTNGNFTDYTYYDLGIPSQTVELTDGFAFEFPDDDGMLQQVFNDNLDFALSYAESARDPAHPVSPERMGPIEILDVYHTPLTDSYGSHQIIEVLARKELDLTLHYDIGGGEQTATFAEKLGETYNDRPGTYYSRYVANIGGQSAGNTVNYRITWGEAEQLGPYSYNVTSASGNPILVVAAEDYSGNLDYGYDDKTQPNYLHYYTDALDASSYAYDVWDVDLQGVPSSVEVLSHYDVAVWYTGNDWAPEVPEWLTPYWDETLNFREFLNYEDGKLFATGQALGHLSTYYSNYSDDFLQYYLGSYMNIEQGGIDLTSGLPFDVRGEDVFDELTFSLQGGDGADNQCCADTFLNTNYFLPHFDYTVAARYNRPGGPFDPHSGDYYVYSQMADMAYKRLGGTFTLPADSPALKFWLSYDIETNWDFAFVEISEAGSGVWTTLPDKNGLTTPDTGDSCASGWVDEIHPFLAHYMATDCSSPGSTGLWNAFTDNSGGWQQAEMDLSAYAGKTVEIYISYASDWSVQGLGVFVDDVELSGNPLEDFEAGMGGWAVSVAPGSGAFNNWVRMTGAGFPEGPAIQSSDSVYLGFGFEAIDNADDRNDVMDRVMDHLGQ